MFIVDNSYTREDIHNEVGGSVQSFLPTVDGRVVCACLSKEMNPNAPNEILVGNKPRVVKSAEQFSKQSFAVPVFIKEASNEWIYQGDYIVKKDTYRNEGIDDFDLAGREDIQIVLELEEQHKSNLLENKMTNKTEAYEFLKSLHKKLDSELPSPDAMRENIPSVVQEAKKDDNKKHMRQAEDAFLHHYAFPILFEHMLSVEGVDHHSAVDSLLSEYYRNMPQYCKNTPARKQRHPFSKVISTSTDTIMKQWKGELSGAKLKQSCPDFALTAPFPFKIVFEGKYFSKGGSKKAETEFVTNVYQAFFYRGLPYLRQIG